MTTRSRCHTLAAKLGCELETLDGGMEPLDDVDTAAGRSPI